MQGGHDGEDDELRREQSTGEEADPGGELLQDRLRLSTASIAKSQAKKSGKSISEQAITRLANLASRFAEVLAVDVDELFQKDVEHETVTAEDVRLSAQKHGIDLWKQTISSLDELTDRGLPPWSYSFPTSTPPYQGSSKIGKSALPLSAGVRMSGQITSHHGEVSNRFDRKFIYSNFSLYDKQVSMGRNFRSLAFLDDMKIAVGRYDGMVEILKKGTALDSYYSGQFPVLLVQSAVSTDGHLILASSNRAVNLWRPKSLWRPNEMVIKYKRRQNAARFNNEGLKFATAPLAITETFGPQVRLYDVTESKEEGGLFFSPECLGFNGYQYSPILYSRKHDDRLLLWNGSLWDIRLKERMLVHMFDKLTDYGGGAFHPTKNELIINSDVFDIRNFQRLQTVPCLDETLITFNGGGDVIYAIPRRNKQRGDHSLCSSFLTVDALNYQQIASTSVGGLVSDFVSDNIDDSIALITEDYEDIDRPRSYINIYKVGERKKESEAR